MGHDISRRAMLCMAALGMTAAAAGCAGGEETPPPRPIAFVSAPISLNVAEIKVVVRPRPITGGEIEDEFSVSPEQVARLWAAQRLKAVGAAGRAQVMIDDASARSSLNRDGEETILVGLQMRVIVENAAGEQAAGAGVRVESRGRVAGRQSVADREAYLDALSRDIADKLDAQLTASARKGLAAYIAAY